MKNNLLYGNLNRNEIAAKLLEIADKKLLVKRTVYKFKNNSFYSTVFNQDEVESELMFTITATLNALEKYNASKLLMMEREVLTKKLPKNDLNKIVKAIQFLSSQKEKESAKAYSKVVQDKVFKAIKKRCTLQYLTDMWSADVGSLNLDNEAMITGYLIQAFQNNISKIYGKHQTDKRSFKEMIYLDSYHEESEDSSYMKNKLESHTAIEPIKEREYSKTIVEMAKFLRSYDKRQNQINQNQKSQLTKLFCAIVNPKKVEDNDELRNRFGWSQYLLNKNKEIMMDKIKEGFSDSKEQILEYLDTRERKNRAS